MRDEEAYGEFVGARWPALFRFAALLTGAEDTAAEVLRAALVRAFVDWPRISRSDSPEAWARRLVVEALGSDDGDLASSGLRGLPPRQRAVMVLRSYDGLGDPDVARVLDCPAATVTALASAAERSLAGSAAGLTRALWREASSVEVPEAPVAALVEDGRQQVRSRRRRTLLRAGVALAALGLAALTVDRLAATTAAPPGPPGSTVEPPSAFASAVALADLPRGEASALPYLRGRTLVARGGVHRVGPDATVVVGGRRTVAVSDTTVTGFRVRLLRADGSLRELTAAAAGPPVVSADGRYVAWESTATSAAGGTARVRVYDVRASRRVGTVGFPFIPSCCDSPFGLVGMDADGRLVGNGQGSAWVASLGFPAVRVSGLQGGYVAQVVAHEVVVDHLPLAASDEPSVLVGPLGVGGDFVARASAPSRAGTVSPDGRWIATVVGQRVRVTDTEDGGSRPLSLAGGADLESLVWEDPDAVLVAARGRGPRGPLTWVRCRPDDGRCEVAATLTGRITLPVR